MEQRTPQQPLHPRIFDPITAAAETWEALVSADVFVTGDFVFASGEHATLKVDAERLYSAPKQLAVILGHFAAHPVIQRADALLYVPDGMRQFTYLLGEATDIPVIDVRRKSNATSKYDFEFPDQSTAEAAHSAKAPVICEDVVSTLGSVAAVRELLSPEQTVQSLAILLRGTVNPNYRVGLQDHYLITKPIPTDKDEFDAMISEESKHSK